MSSVGGSLHVVVKSLPSIQIEADASVNITQDERILVKDLDVTFTGDTILEDSVSTFDDAVRVYKKFGTVAKSSQAVVKFSLSPIENYCKVKIIMINMLQLAIDTCVIKTQNSVNISRI